MRILLLEDDANTAAYILKGLEEEGHTVDHLADGRDAVAQAVSENYDVIILDRMLPSLDGLAIIKTIRSAGRGVPGLVPDGARRRRRSRRRPGRRRRRLSG